MIHTRLTALIFMTGAILTAQNNTSFVAASGSDANPCTQLSPCATFGAAYNKTNSGGFIRALSSGDFGPLNVTKPVTIDGGGFNAASIGGISVDITGSTVTIRNLSIQITATGSTAAIGAALRTSLALGSSTLNVEDVQIAAMGSLSAGLSIGTFPGAVINLRNVSIQAPGGSNIGAFNATATHCQVNLSASDFEGSTGSNPALSIDGCDVNAVNSRFHNNSTGLVISNNTSASNTLIKGADFSMNSVALQVGTFATTTNPANVRLDTTSFTSNSTAIQTFNGATVISYRSNIFFNNTTDGASPLTTSYR